MSIDNRLFQSILNNTSGDKFLIRSESEYIIKPQFDLKVNADVNWEKKCASLSIEFKLFLT